MSSRRRRDGARRPPSAGGAGNNRLLSAANGAWALSSFDASTMLQTANPGGVAGSAVNGLSMVFVLGLLQVPTGTQVLSGRASGVSGWGSSSSGAVLSFNAGNGVANAVAPTRTWVAGDVGKIHVWCGTCDLTAVYAYMDNAQVGTSTALVGYAAAENAMCYGSANSGSPAVDYYVLGMCGRDSHLTLADYQTICAATKLAGSLSLGGISMDHMWKAPSTTTVPSTLSDSLGASNMTFTLGSAANLVSSRIPRAWGF